MRFIGDVHGKYKRYKKLIKNAKDTIQVGDMGVGFKRYDPVECVTLYHANPPYEHMVAGNHRFIRGNHDNPGDCKQHSQWIEDGHVEGDMMFIGGAVSIDAAWRQEGYSWWPDEELSTKELNLLVEKACDVKPRIMVTHTAPDWLTPALAWAANRGYKLDYPSRTEQALDGLWHNHKPELWIFGHWHVDFEYCKDGCRFLCLDELSTYDLVDWDDLTKGGISPGRPIAK